MKCSKCNKDFEAVVKKAYALGAMNGEYRLKSAINKILKNNNILLHANRRLAHELLNLDLLLPLEGTPSVVISFKKAKSILGLLPPHSEIFKYLQKLIGEQMIPLS